MLNKIPRHDDDICCRSGFRLYVCVYVNAVCSRLTMTFPMINKANVLNCVIIKRINVTKKTNIHKLNSSNHVYVTVDQQKKTVPPSLHSTLNIHSRVQKALTFSIYIYTRCATFSKWNRICGLQSVFHLIVTTHASRTQTKKNKIQNMTKIDKNNRVSLRGHKMA